MCGICGIVSFDGRAASTLESQLTRAISELEHRGPDATRVHAETAAVLGACRLAIRGGPLGGQPLISPGGAVVVCNGEIDNHRELRHWLAGRGHHFPDASDLNVLPALYDELGTAMVERIDGAFALAVWDPRSERLLLARDRAGERPLFFARWRDGAGFASELAALQQLPRTSAEVDLEALRGYLRRGYFDSPLSPFRDVEKVGCGETVVISASASVRRKYWRWQIERGPHAAPSMDELDDALRSAVRRQTDNDCDHGFFLSGGVDSSLLLALACEGGARAPVRAFALRFLESSFDEGKAARRVAATYSVPFEEVWVRAEDFPSWIDRLLASAGEPLADPAWVPTALLAERAARSVRVVVSGEGADELFGGYPTYPGIALADRLARLPRPLRASLTFAANALPPSQRKVPLSYLLRRLVEGLELSGLARHRAWTAAVPERILAQLGIGAEEDSTTAASVDTEALNEAQEFDVWSALAEGLLTKADRAAMLHALEVRAPFLDRGVASVAARLPPEERVRGLRTKVFLKRYARQRLPARVVEARKRGLSVPLAAWLRGPLREFAEEALRSHRLETLGLRSDAVLHLFGEHQARRADHARTIWTLVVASRWFEWATVVGRRDEKSP